MWTLQGQQAQLQTSNFSGTLDLGVPGAGLHQLCFSEQPLAAVGLLGVSLAQKLIDVSQIKNHYTRDNCLVASYGDVQKTDCHAQLQWRCIDPQSGLWLQGLELIISFEAPLLTRLPEWKTTSEISNQLIFSTVDDNAQTWNRIDQNGNGHPSDENRYKMILCRFPEQKLSYLEMVHCQQPCLTVFPTVPHAEPEITRWGMQMSADHLEKGVILRRVLRGLFLPLEEDEALARKAYQHFSTVAPPLN